MLLVGGKDDDGTLQQKTGYIVDWTTKTSIAVPSLDLDVPMWAMSCSYYKAENPQDDKVIMAGGCDSSCFLNDLKVLDLSALAWTNLPGKSQTNLGCNIVQ